MKAMSTKELAAYYHVTPTTFRKWIRPFQSEIGDRIGNYWMPNQVHQIMCAIENN